MLNLMKTGRPMNPYGDGFSEQLQKITTLTPFLELDSWTPLMASLLVSGIQPPQDCTEIPAGAFGLDGAFITGKEDAFHVARRVLELWNSREDAPAKVRPADFVAWCKTKNIKTHWLSEIDTAPPATEPQAAPVVVVALGEPDKACTVAVKTRAMADSFAGLRWSGKEWLKKLGNKTVWLNDCLVLNRARGEGMRQWNPVLIGAYLVRMKHAKANSVRARFQTEVALIPWLDEWKTYEANNFTTD